MIMQPAKMKKMNILGYTSRVSQFPQKQELTMKSFAIYLFLFDSLVTAKLGASLHRHSTAHRLLQSLIVFGSDPQHTLGHCEGDCDTDSDW